MVITELSRGRSLGVALAAFVGLCGCAQDDLGAPCNHSVLATPREPVITFPALACDELLCVYGERVVEPAGVCTSDSDCEVPGSTGVFECVEQACRVRNEHVLERSMCSQYCGDDNDCADAVSDTTCKTGFACAPLMSLGEQCCQKVCVCRDNLDVATTDTLAQACAEGTAPGCCNRDPRPAACGP